MSNQARERNFKVDNLTTDNPIKTHSPAKQRRSRLSLVATLLTVAMLIGVNTGVFASESVNSYFIMVEGLCNKYENLIETESLLETMEAYKNDVYFIDLYQSSPDECLEMIDLGLEAKSIAKNNIQTFGGSYNQAYTYVPGIRQKETFSCSVVSMMQALCSRSIPGFSRNITQQQSEVLEAQLLIELGVKSNSDIAPGQIVSWLNSRLGFTAYRAVYIGANTTNAEVANLLRTSLLGDFPPIINARNTAYLSYYNGYSTGHYITVNMISTMDNIVSVVDCNYNTSFSGGRSTTVDQVRNSTRSKGTNSWEGFIIVGI